MRNWLGTRGRGGFASTLPGGCAMHARSRPRGSGSRLPAGLGKEAAIHWEQLGSEHLGWSFHSPQKWDKTPPPINLPLQRADSLPSPACPPYHIKFPVQGA